MREWDGGFLCTTCLKIKFEEEAKEQGCKILGPCDKKQARRYLLPCGHEQDIRLDHMKRGVFKCHACLQERLEAEAREQGCELLGPGKNRQYRLYRFPCGHEQEAVTSHVRIGNILCTECQIAKLAAEAKERGCELLGPGSNRNNRTYKLVCGHEQDVRVSAMKDGQVRCQTCLEQDRKNAATAQNCEFIGPAKNKTTNNTNAEMADIRTAVL